MLSKAMQEIKGRSYPFLKSKGRRKSMRKRRMRRTSKEWEGKGGRDEEEGRKNKEGRTKKE